MTIMFHRWMIPKIPVPLRMVMFQQPPRRSYIQQQLHLSSSVFQSRTNTTTTTATATKSSTSTAVTLSMDLLKELRNRTGAPIVDCKKAIQEAQKIVSTTESSITTTTTADAAAAADSSSVPVDRMYQTALDWLRSHGAAKATHKVAGRTTTQGLVAIQISNDGTTASIVKVASETDFAALSQTFIQLVQTIVQTVLVVPPSPPSHNTVEMILQQPVVVVEEDTSTTTSTSTSSSSTLTIQDCLNDAIVSIRENISITDAIHLPKVTIPPMVQSEEDHHGIYAGYVHNRVDTSSHHQSNNCSMDVVNAGTAAAIVLLVPTTTTASSCATKSLTLEELQTMGKQLAMHIVAAKPQYLSISDIPTDVIEKERMIVQQQLQNDPSHAKKPLPILEKIIQGKLQKYYESIVLLEQSHYIVEGNPKIATYLQQHHVSLARYEYLAI